MCTVIPGDIAEALTCSVHAGSEESVLAAFPDINISLSSADTMEALVVISPSDYLETCKEKE